MLVVEGGRLPLGVLEGVSAMVKEVELRPGDVIVMGSDGAMEAGDGAMEEALAEKRTLAPDRLSEELLRTAEFLAQDGRPGRYDRCVHRRRQSARALSAERRIAALEAFEEPLDRNTAGETPRSQRVLKTSAQARPRPRRSSQQGVSPEAGDSKSVPGRETARTSQGAARECEKKFEKSGGSGPQTVDKAPFFNAEGRPSENRAAFRGRRGKQAAASKMSKRTYARPS